jgi:hypothetical protein
VSGFGGFFVMLATITSGLLAAQNLSKAPGNFVPSSDPS